jgi:hypothetical protein
VITDDGWSGTAIAIRANQDKNHMDRKRIVAERFFIVYMNKEINLWFAKSLKRVMGCDKTWMSREDLDIACPPPVLLF